MSSTNAEVRRCSTLECRATANPEKNDLHHLVSWNFSHASRVFRFRYHGGKRSHSGELAQTLHGAIPKGLKGAAGLCNIVSGSSASSVSHCCSLHPSRTPASSSPLT